MIENYPKFLKNEPIGEDQFEGKSQESIAKVISQSLQNNDYGIIGIDGTWGSGKSNLVRIVEKNLISKNFHFFIYDVWGHQEDEQRRTILEELTEYIKTNNLVEQKKWSVKLKELLAKNRETITKKKPILSLGVIVSLIALLLIPFLKATGDEMTSDWKYVIYLSPFLLLLLCYLYYYYKNFNSNGNVYLIALNKLFELYQKDKIEETTFQTITEDEPSVKKFRDWIMEIDKDLKSQKIVLVFDNFDRLPKEKILGLWSSIHIFFSDQKYDNLKVIIPFDREHIKNAFGDLNSNDQEFGNYAEDYINKTFDIVYRVAPPILTNWKNYFQKKWIECFGEGYDEQEFSRTVQIYELLNKKITPREIIVLINEIATLTQIHNNTIPANYFALFVINKDKILKNPVAEIIKPTYLQGLETIYQNDINLAKYITAIVYQLDPEKSLEVIYSQQLKDALINKDYEQLEKIAEAGFFTPILETTYPTITKEFLPNAVITLDKIPLEKYASVERENLIWKDLIQSAKLVKSDDHNIMDFQKVIVSRIPVDEEKKDYIEKIIEEIVYEKEWDTENYAKNIDDLQQFIEDQNIDVYELLTYYEIERVEDFIPLLKSKKHEYEKYRIDVSAEQLDGKLIEIDADQFAEIDYLTYLNRDEYKLPKFRSKLLTAFKNSFSDNNILPEIMRLLKYYDEPIKTSDIEDSTLHSRFTTVTEKDNLYYDFVAIRLTKTLNLGGYQSYFNSAVAKVEDEYVEKVAKRILQYISYGDLLLKYKEFKDVPLYVEVVKKLTFNDSIYGSERLNLNSIVTEFDEITNKLKIDKTTFLKKLGRWGTDVKQNSIKTLSNDFFEVALNVDNLLSEKIIELKKEYFDNLTKDEWFTIFSDFNSEEFEILKTLDYKNWSSFAHEALKDVFIEKTSSIESDDIDDHERYSELIHSMEAFGHKFKNTFDDVRDQFINKNNIDNDSFYFFGHWLFKYSNLKFTDSIRKIFKTELLDEEHSVEILLSNVKKLKSILEFGGDEAQDFINALIDKSKTNNNILVLAEKLGVIKKSKK